MSTKPHALVFGASGISGWALLKEALGCPAPTTFEYVTAVTNRPLITSNTQCVVGLTGSVDSIVSALNTIETVSPVFLFVYLDPGKDNKDLKKANTGPIRTAVEATQNAASNVKSSILQLGGKAYGLECPNAVEVIPPPNESYPRVSNPIADDIFYYSQYDVLETLSKGSSWTFTGIRSGNECHQACIVKSIAMEQGFLIPVLSTGIAMSTSTYSKILRL
ncbi:uncharacterized protein Z518_05760 [Rhinocladiella mackenziei CBS 650.93]|uniref:PRISE-like Rossmann-fold domain-containing protein n=1 Tax=Rhinocladiella mackenziei CBS 650.93 TaxID=1442369 RepID=A0A0D2IGJ4_9EURO|nr:uncharacterized protein Z518_05760 [Rhinocladiella mackenziei CBS 650.93]KIX04889.1 hypothetical protein Z518_05760 [Rhinocladiella mackenziei CBS 650.93]